MTFVDRNNNIASYGAHYKLLSLTLPLPTGPLFAVLTALAAELAKQWDAVIDRNVSCSPARWQHFHLYLAGLIPFAHLSRLKLELSWLLQEQQVAAVYALSTPKWRLRSARSVTCTGVEGSFVQFSLDLIGSDQLNVVCILD